MSKGVSDIVGSDLESAEAEMGPNQDDALQLFARSKHRLSNVPKSRFATPSRSMTVFQPGLANLARFLSPVGSFNARLHMPLRGLFLGNDWLSVRLGLLGDFDFSFFAFFFLPTGTCVLIGEVPRGAPAKRSPSLSSSTCLYRLCPCAFSAGILFAALGRTEARQRSSWLSWRALESTFARGFEFEPRSCLHQARYSLPILSMFFKLSEKDAVLETAPASRVIIRCFRLFAG